MAAEVEVHRERGVLVARVLRCRESGEEADGVVAGVGRPLGADELTQSLG